MGHWLDINLMPKGSYFLQFFLSNLKIKKYADDKVRLYILYTSGSQTSSPVTKSLVTLLYQRTYCSLKRKSVDWICATDLFSYKTK